MAMMIPGTRAPDEFGDNKGEKLLYTLLRDKLPPEYIVFHSLDWKNRDNRERKRTVEKRLDMLDQSEADYTVFHPRRGLLTIEVKGSKQGTIVYRDNKWYYANGHEMKHDPLDQAECSRYTIHEELKENELYYKVRSAVWFPMTNSVEGKLPLAYDEAILLRERDTDDPLKAIERVFEYYGMNEQHRHPSETQRVIDALAPKFGILQSLRDNLMAQDRQFKRLTREQFYLLDFLEEQRTAAIQGGAGTGKTLLAEEKARRLSQDGKVLFLCYNDFLCSRLQRDNDDLYRQGRVDYYTIDSFATRYAKDADRPIVINEGRKDDRKRTDENILRFLKSYKSEGYRHIVIDEGQDIDCDVMVELIALAETLGGDFYVFYDRYQRLQQKKKDGGEESADSLAWLELMECRLVLSRNCRNTECIAKTSYRPVRAKGLTSKASVHDESPSLWIVEGAQQVKEKVIERIKHYTDREAGRLQAEDIVILTLKGDGNSKILKSGEKLAGFELTATPNTPGKILFTTARKFKGLEAFAVIVIDIDESSFSELVVNPKTKKEEPTDETMLLYVAASRAKTCLDLVAILDEKQLRAVSCQLAGAKAKNFRSPELAIEKELGVKVYQF
ncbi:MAG: NERD domain-containing protein/DEAD/DEAH box helicase [Firmicutes bacterium]|nr:NERD domain-containing protein/DEAD/DEAH box helicase [Bacillota bacterium]